MPMCARHCLSGGGGAHFASVSVHTVLLAGSARALGQPHRLHWHVYAAGTPCVAPPGNASRMRKFSNVQAPQPSVATRMRQVRLSGASLARAHTHTSPSCHAVTPGDTSVLRSREGRWRGDDDDGGPRHRPHQRLPGGASQAPRHPGRGHPVPVRGQHPVLVHVRYPTVHGVPLAHPGDRQAHLRSVGPPVPSPALPGAPLSPPALSHPSLSPPSLSPRPSRALHAQVRRRPVPSRPNSVLTNLCVIPLYQSHLSCTPKCALTLVCAPLRANTLASTHTPTTPTVPPVAKYAKLIAFLKELLAFLKGFIV